MKINPRQLEKMAKKMGIETHNVDATEVIIRTLDKEIVISNPQVSRVNMMGQDSWQITGDASERSIEPFSDEDVKLVARQAGVSEEKARETLASLDGDIAEAIMKLKK
jgi:nascent polypeptide-associated complex subunit alpha